MNVPISGPILKVKAKELMLKPDHRDLTCSTGWLERFKSRHAWHCFGHILVQVCDQNNTMPGFKPWTMM